MSGIHRNATAYYTVSMFAVDDMRPAVLLTGFGPFPGIPVNASADLVRDVVRRAGRTFPAFRFVAAILPTEWRRAPGLVAELHDRFAPVLSLHFGVAAGTEGIRLETRAENVCRASFDAVNLMPLTGTLCVDGPATRQITLDIPAISQVLNDRGWPCSTSEDAGGYLCNAVLYQSLASAEARGGGAVGFVHIPSGFSNSLLTLEETSNAALAIIATALEAVSTTTAPTALAAASE